MSDTPTTETTPKKVYATLIRGSLYVYHDKTFEAGKPVEVNEAEASYLAAEAVDLLNIEGEEVVRPKFAISHDGDENVSGDNKSRPRTRAR